MTELAAYAASLTIGLSLGLIGAGGSILTIPVFVYILQNDPISSSIYSMFVVGICSLVGSIRSMYNQLVDFRVAALFGMPSIAGVLIARKIFFPLIPTKIFSIGRLGLSKEMLFMVCLAFLMFLAAVRMLNTSTVPEADRPRNRQRETLQLLLQGLVVGVITGVLGIGGGFLIVPALYFWAHLPMKKSIGTTLLIITINSLISFVASYNSIVIDWHLLSRFSVGSIIGILVGTWLSSRLAGKALKRIFGWFVLAIAFYIICRQFFL